MIIGKVEKPERRTERITVTLTPTERNKLEDQARAQGVAITDYIRHLVRYVQHLEDEEKKHTITKQVERLKPVCHLQEEI